MHSLKRHPHKTNLHLLTKNIDNALFLPATTTRLLLIDVVFFIFAASELKKRIKKEKLKHQYGSKSAGAKTMIHIIQQITVQNPDFDVFSADAIKALYSLNRDLALRKLKDEAYGLHF